MRGDLIRILSDVHYGDRASRVRDLAQLKPLVDQVDGLIFNGDTLDTRPGPRADHTAACREEVTAFAADRRAPVTFLTGNHDPDFSPHHSLDLAGGEVFVIHGDVLFEDMVPWGRDAREIRNRIAAATEGRAPRMMPLEERIAIWRHVAGTIPQRHQSEQDPLKYAARFLLDTVWPPTRFLQIFRAWHREPRLAAALVRRHRPKARYVILGHTHRPTIRSVPGGPTIINTGAFTAPFGGYAVDLLPGRLQVRRVDYRGDRFEPGSVVAEFPLANA